MVNEKSIEAYPLHWPEGYKRRKIGERVSSRFKNRTVRDVWNDIENEIRLLGGRNLIISSNLKTKANGDPYSSQRLKRDEDSGVAIYFQWKGASRSLCCDKFQDVWENGYSLAQTISRMRDIDRWGASEVLDRMFTGFLSIAEDAGKSAISILGLGDNPTEDEIRRAFREKAKQLHPDINSSDGEAMIALNTAYQNALQSLNL